MPTLDTRGKLAAAEIGFYAPIAIITLLLIFRYVLRRDAGWLFLYFFSAIRIAGGALVVAGQLAKPPNTNLLDVSYIMDYVGLSALLLSTLGFIGMAGQHTYSENRRFVTSLRLTGFLILAGVGVGAAGGAIGIKPTGNASLATTLRRVCVCIFVAAFILLLGLHSAAWTYRWHLRSYRRSLLIGITFAIPFLGARIAYAVLAAWSASDLRGAHPSSSTAIAKFNPVTGNWILFLVLDLVMEWVVAALYLFASTVLAQRRHH